MVEVAVGSGVRRMVFLSTTGSTGQAHSVSILEGRVERLSQGPTDRSSDPLPRSQAGRFLQSDNEAKEVGILGEKLWRHMNVRG